MRTNTTSFSHLRHYIHKQFTILTPTIEPHYRLQQDIGLNPTEVIEVIVVLELLCGITLPDEVLTPSLSGGQLCALLEQYAQTNDLRQSSQLGDVSNSQLKLLSDTGTVSKLA